MRPHGVEQQGLRTPWNRISGTAVPRIRGLVFGSTFTGRSRGQTALFSAARLAAPTRIVGWSFRHGCLIDRPAPKSIIADETNDLTPMMRALLKELWNEFQAVDTRLAVITRNIEALAARNDTARRLMTIPGVGPIAATALLAAIGNGRLFRKARDLAAWLGLVPRQSSTGGKTTLLGISKRGNPYVRRLIIHGARSCVAHLNRQRDKLGGWIDRLEARMPTRLSLQWPTRLLGSRGPFSRDQARSTNGLIRRTPDQPLGNNCGV